MVAGLPNLSSDALAGVGEAVTSAAVTGDVAQAFLFELAKLIGDTGNALAPAPDVEAEESGAGETETDSQPESPEASGFPVAFTPVPETTVCDASSIIENRPSAVQTGAGPATSNAAVIDEYPKPLARPVAAHAAAELGQAVPAKGDAVDSDLLERKVPAETLVRREDPARQTERIPSRIRHPLEWARTEGGHRTNRHHGPEGCHH